MATALALLVLCGLAYKGGGVGGVQITDLRVPGSVRNGSGQPAILDCEYSLRPDELTPDSGLVVKWFFNQSPAPVYQWIPSLSPQELGVLRGQLKLDYRASRHQATMHRALYILNPTTALSGDYKCSVSTFADEDFMIKKMIVYAPERRLEMSQTRDLEKETVNISCLAQGVFPEPKMALYRSLDKNKTRVPLEGVRLETVARVGAYDISAAAVLDQGWLLSHTVFHCHLRIPGTPYTNAKTLDYYPWGMERLSSADGGEQLSRWRVWSLVSILYALHRL